MRPSWCTVRNDRGVGVGGHISIRTSSAALWSNNHFRWQSRGGGDQCSSRAASPGIYARPFLEGRLTARATRRIPPGTAMSAAGCRLSTPAHARLLGIPHRVDGFGPAQRHLPGTVQPLSARPRIKDTSINTCGVFGRQRDGRTRGRGLAHVGAEADLDLRSAAICNDSTARCAAAAKSSRSWSRSSAVPAGTSSKGGVGPRMGCPAPTAAIALVI